jgi:nitrite reductase/ring-hydroxylating ferredoxin subunit/DMSO/TMAO reductase YedYZ heme-binding membrane subunit
MTVKYRPVQWNRNKYVYDAVVLAAIGLYLWGFIKWAPGFLEHKAVGGPELVMRAFGTCAFLLLTAILSIGPLARLDRRFLPLLYNRRHFGVMLFFVALSHALFVNGWYQAFTPIDSYVALLASNTNVTSFRGFPFEYLGIAALTILFVMAATSHDFWLSFLGAPLWKAIHMGVYLCYGLVAMHVILGALQTERHPVYALVVGGSIALVAARREARYDEGHTTLPADEGGWVVAARVEDIPREAGLPVVLPSGERAALFRYGDRISALSNACAHQNGPLGEGRVIDGCVTCPWHGFQYRPEDGCSPAPFTEKVPTFRVKLSGDSVLIDPNPLPPGTPTPPIVLGGLSRC